MQDMFLADGIVIKWDTHHEDAIDLVRNLLRALRASSGYMVRTSDASLASLLLSLEY